MQNIAGLIRNREDGVFAELSFLAQKILEVDATNQVHDDVDAAVFDDTAIKLWNPRMCECRK